MDLASIYFGFFLAVFVFTQAKVVQQTRIIWRHRRSLLNAYLVMIWVEAWVNFVFALITYLYLNGVIQGSLGFYVASVLLWAVQTQLLLQIVANRVSLIMLDPRKARKMRWGLFLAVGAINIAVAIIWVTAMMPGATPFQATLNIMFEKAEKSFFLVVDLGLNLYFLYLVRFRLIADGLSKYWTLFHFNAAIVLLSTSMDCLLLGFLSLSDPYLQFAPVAYIVKLHIELSNASLIAKVVRSSSTRPQVGMDASSGHNTKSHTKTDDAINPMTSRAIVTSSAPPLDETQRTWEEDFEARSGSSASNTHLAPYADEKGNGIMRTVETMVVVDCVDGYENRRRSVLLDA
ncbi:hypothetical protein B0T14DRAFT_475756 [Immersiella caudata]|uniref:Uncharacterized protein n=1 Tax=Immersiella caudata TaxID=314043 RepID=A0AA40C279_9PEZI|nr:hypothetical protein B0T14DRAFT_475756 [Immersiella caudata]